VFYSDPFLGAVLNTKTIYMKKINITQIAYYLPPTIVDNTEMAKRFPHAGTPGEILKKAGIKERRYSSISTMEMATKAIESLIEKCSISKNDIDCLLVGTITPDYFFPSVAACVIDKLEMKGVTGWDFNAACSGFTFGLQQAVALVQSGMMKKCIVCVSDRMSQVLNSFDYKTGILFGDAAVAVLVEEVPGTDFGINGIFTEIVPFNLHDVYFKTPFHPAVSNWSEEKFELDGAKVYRHGVGFTMDIIKKYLQLRSLTLSDFDFFIPHQANMRMLQEIRQQLGCPDEKFLTNVELMGNTIAASIPLCLAQNKELGIINRGDRLLFCSFGAGYTLGIVDMYCY
jgi:3-oxoacyl-[acyl-carrier-protein] synthase-3